MAPNANMVVTARKERVLFWEGYYISAGLMEFVELDQTLLEDVQHSQHGGECQERVSEVPGKGQIRREHEVVLQIQCHVVRTSRSSS